MAYWKKPTGISTLGLDSNTLGGKGGGSASSTLPEFYEIEPGLVIDIILDKNHPYFKGPPGFTVDPNRSPPDVTGKKPSPADPDFSWMGRALVRLVYTQRRVEKEDCVWAMPIETNISEYPLLNEYVEVIQILGQYYYRRKLNWSNFVNANPDFNAEPLIGGFRVIANGAIFGNRELQINTKLNQELNYTEYQGPISKLNTDNGRGWTGVLGRYFLFNERIRSLKRREGDMIFESRFGQSIRFGAYDDIRENDKGDKNLTDYYREGLTYKAPDPITGKLKTYEAGGGNPMILIRNRQRPIAPAGKSVSGPPNVPPVKGTLEEKNTAGYILEDVNNDGSSIHITSGKTKSIFVSTCYKKMFGQGEEQSAFEPFGSTKFSYPTLLGDQIVINSDRIVISARTNEMFHFSKKRMAFVTDDEYTVDAHNQIVFTTNTKTVLNSPAIYLGEYDQTGEPAVLGQQLVNWLTAFCNWTMTHTHWHKHVHPDAQGGQVGLNDPKFTQTPVQVAALNILKNNLQSILSRRVFLTGGGYAPGQDGGELK